MLQVARRVVVRTHAVSWMQCITYYNILKYTISCQDLGMLPLAPAKGHLCLMLLVWKSPQQKHESAGCHRYTCVVRGRADGIDSRGLRSSMLCRLCQMSADLISDFQLEAVPAVLRTPYGLVKDEGHPVKRRMHYCRTPCNRTSRWHSETWECSAVALQVSTTAAMATAMLLIACL